MTQVICSKDGVRMQVASWRDAGETVGLVPTMGYLHEGHLSLIGAAKAACDRVVVSIFVNPLQFGPDEDYDSYPRDLAHDLALCEEMGVDVIFHPAVEEMYSADFATHVGVDALGNTLCGASRPVHFGGVCTVVSKLFNIVAPDKAFFGQKDAQQLAIVKRMAADLDIPLEVVGCPIIRENDGLAKSSRNTYLSPQERQAALCLSRAIFAAEKSVSDGERDAEALKEQMTQIIQEEPLARIDYIEVVDGVSMQPVSRIGASALIAMAVYVGKTRLIDNFIFEA